MPTTRLTLLRAEIQGGALEVETLTATDAAGRHQVTYLAHERQVVLGIEGREEGQLVVDLPEDVEFDIGSAQAVAGDWTILAWPGRDEGGLFVSVMSFTIPITKPKTNFDIASAA